MFLFDEEDKIQWVGQWQWMNPDNEFGLPTRFSAIKKNVCVNFLEVNYKLALGILLRQPKLGEILLENQLKRFPNR